jgi:hypothetical protein
VGASAVDDELHDPQNLELLRVAMDDVAHEDGLSAGCQYAPVQSLTT